MYLSSSCQATWYCMYPLVMQQDAAWQKIEVCKLNKLILSIKVTCFTSITAIIWHNFMFLGVLDIWTKMFNISKILNAIFFKLSKKNGCVCMFNFYVHFSVRAWVLFYFMYRRLFKANKNAVNICIAYVSPCIQNALLCDQRGGG